MRTKTTRRMAAALTRAIDLPGYDVRDYFALDGDLPNRLYFWADGSLFFLIECDTPKELWAMGSRQARLLRREYVNRVALRLEGVL